MDNLIKTKAKAGLRCCSCAPENIEDCHRMACPYAQDNECIAKMCKDAAKAISCYEWISVEEALPKDGEKSVLAVKQLKDGRRDICIARCIPDYEHYDPDTRQRVRSPYWVCGGNNNIIYWMPLPEIPEETC